MRFSQYDQKTINTISFKFQRVGDYAVPAWWIFFFVNQTVDPMVRIRQTEIRKHFPWKFVVLENLLLLKICNPRSLPSYRITILEYLLCSNIYPPGKLLSDKFTSRKVYYFLEDLLSEESY